MGTFHLLLLLIPSLISANEVPDIEKSLQDDSIPLIGIKWLSYHNKADAQKNWVNCSFCLNCPQVSFYQEPDPPSDPKSPPAIFYDCPDVLYWVDDAIRRKEINNIGLREKYSVDYTTISNKGLVRTSHRTFTTPDEELEKGPTNFPPDVDLTLTGKLVLKNAKPGKELKSSSQYYDPPKGSEKHWIDMSCKAPSRIMTTIKGESMDGHSIREINFEWNLKSGLTRYQAFRNMVEWEQYHTTGCHCVKLQKNSYEDVHSELVKHCRKLLQTKRDDIRAAVRLSECLSRDERKEMKKRLNSLKIEL